MFTNLLGWYGLAAAKTYLDLHPSASIFILESGESAGGVWAKERLYPGLKTNNMLGLYEYSDFPMGDAYGIKPGQHISGAAVHKYLTDYAQHFGILNRIRFQTKVISAEHQNQGGWLVTCSSTSTAQDNYQILTSKLIVATGLTSEPTMPKIFGCEQFDTPLFHCKDFAKMADTLKTAKSVCVLGGTKSAWDVVYAYGSQGIKVNWIIRQSGTGPTWSE